MDEQFPSAVGCLGFFGRAKKGRVGGGGYGGTAEVGVGVREGVVFNSTKSPLSTKSRAW